MKFHLLVCGYIVTVLPPHNKTTVNKLNRSLYKTIANRSAIMDSG